jgi:hypothetical protein
VAALSGLEDIVPIAERKEGMGTNIVQSVVNAQRNPNGVFVPFVANRTKVSKASSHCNNLHRLHLHLLLLHPFQLTKPPPRIESVLIARLPTMTLQNFAKKYCPSLCFLLFFLLWINMIMML